MNDPFRKRGRKGPILSSDQGNRQSRAVRSAQAALGSVEAVRAFLNNHHEGLEGRPLDLTEALDRLDRQGWSVEFVLPNGVNRWTVIASSDEGIE